YDVQPVDPLDQWKSSPFKPEVRSGRLYGRGVSDDKGELVSRLKILEAYRKIQGDVPCNFKFCFDGEEEIGSPHLNEYIGIDEDRPFDSDEYLRIDGARGFLGEMTASEAKRALATEPTANISGIWAGYSGPGPKGIVPSEIHCKINFQLVQDQSPERLFDLLL